MNWEETLQFVQIYIRPDRDEYSPIMGALLFAACIWMVVSL